MRNAYFVLILITLIGGWMLFDLWPGLPERIPLLPFGDDLADREVECSVWSWFVVPMTAMLAILAAGIFLPEALLARVAGDRPLPLPAAWQLASLPLAARAKVIRPVCWSLIGAAFAHLAFLMAWWGRAAEAAAATATTATTELQSWSLLASGWAMLGVGWRWSAWNAAQGIPARQSDA